MRRATARTSRRVRRCGCGQTIRPGDRYVEHVMSPGGEFGDDHWHRFAECSSCATRYGRGDAVAAGGAPETTDG